MEGERITMAMVEKDCDPDLEMTATNMEKEMDAFARTFDYTHYANARKIQNEIHAPSLPKVKTWEHYDESFTFPRVRRYGDVQDKMDTLEHFQDNLNMNPENSKHVENFIKYGREVQSAINEKYHNGEFKDPAKPRTDDE